MAIKHKLRNLTVMRICMTRILEAESSFTIPQVGAGIDLNVRTNFVKPCIKRLVTWLCAEGHLTQVDSFKYQLESHAQGDLQVLVKRTKQTDIFLCRFLEIGVDDDDA